MGNDSDENTAQARGKKAAELFPQWLKFDHPLICFDINLKLYIFFNNLAILSIELFWQL